MKRLRYNSLDDRLFHYIKKTDYCWNWIGDKYDSGYGRLALEKGKQVRAHRFLYEQVHGKIPDGMCALHRCDNRACVNPEHIFIGTKKDNMQDCLTKKRHKYIAHHGEDNGNSKLSKADIIKIRELWAKGGIYQSKLAKEFGVSQTVISKVVNYKTWVL